ncbi:MAG: gamma-glutamyltransferase [Granulosicoccus sp.]
MRDKFSLGKRGIRCLASSLLVAGLVLFSGCSGDDGGVNGPIGVPSNDGMAGEDVIAGFTGGVVTAANPIAAEAGAQVLRNGGNAIDAAVVVQFVLNVVEPTSSGIGGGGFMGVHLAVEGRTFFIDSREKAPATASATMFLNCAPTCDSAESETIGSFSERATSGISVGVPGTLLGLAHALEQYGTLSLAEAIEPAIVLAANGFAINERLAMLTENDRTTFWPETRAIFRTAEGEPLSAGSMLVQADLATTFRLIASQGVKALYAGEIAQAIVSAQQRSRAEVGPAGAGRMSVQDLTNYMNAGVVERDPVSSDYRGYSIKGMPSPSSGGSTVAQILECIEQFPIGNVSAGYGPASANTLHVVAESMRLAFSSRSVWMGDADMVSLPDAGIVNADYLAPRCAEISLLGRIEAPEPGDPRVFDPAFSTTDATNISAAKDEPAGVDTTHFTVIDANGNVVTYTSTIEGTWGSGMIVPGFGFLLNNELTDFNSAPLANAAELKFNPGANDVAPGKRPRSSMSPVMVFKDGDLVAAYGSPGGATIINTVVNMTMNLIDHGMSVQDAIDAPRFHTSGGSIALENGFDAAVVAALEDLGHEVTMTFNDSPVELGSVQAIVVNPADGAQYGGADNRRAGEVVGLP